MRGFWNITYKINRVAPPERVKHRMSEKDQAENCAQNKQLRVECALGTPVGYVCEALFTVRRAEDSVGYSGFIPMVRLPVSLIGKTVKATIEECT